MHHHHQFNHHRPPTSSAPADVDIDADALRSMPKEERRALARIAKALLATEDESVKAELAAELQKRCARAAAAANGTANASAPPTMRPFAIAPSRALPSRPVFGVDASTMERDDRLFRGARLEATPSASTRGRDFASEPPSSSERAARMDRAQRFAREAVQFASDIANAKGRGAPTMQEMKMRDAAAVGTNESLEKTYLRLTEAPSMATVRPPRVLARALDMVKKKWEANRDYEYAKDQLKSIRQDLTVQHVRDGALVRETYQTHARVALECGDLAEYNQCQAVLKTLHASLLEDALAANARRGETSTSGKKTKTKKKSSKKRTASERDGDENADDDRENADADADAIEDIAEFTAYRLIYAAGAGSKSERSAALTRELRDVPDALRRHPFVAHAFAACETLASSNFHRFFALHATAPRMSARLMDVVAPSVRHDAARAVLRAHAPTVPVAFVAAALGFPTLDACADYLVDDHDAVFVDTDRTVVNVTETRAALASRAPTSVLARLSRF